MHTHTNHHNASLLAQNATHELMQLRRSLQEAEDNLAGLHRFLKHQTPKGGRRTIKGTRSTPSLLERAGSASLGNLSNTLTRDISGGLSSFYTSASEQSSSLMESLNLGQRIL